MKLRSLVLTSLPLLLLTGVVGSRSDRVTVRVLTYNIRHGEGRDGRLDLRRLADVMQGVDPDIIALQEVDQGTKRAGGTRQLDELARLLGMHAEFGKAMDFAGGRYGVAVLSRWPFVAVANQPLPTSPGDEPRTALTVRIRVGRDGPLLEVTSTHLDQSRGQDDRAVQAAHLNALLVAEDGRPSILAGDFNARSGTDIIAILDAHWTNSLTVGPAPPNPVSGRGRRGLRGDFVLFRPSGNWRVIESRIIDENVASDHRPVLAVLEWLGTS